MYWSGSISHGGVILINPEYNNVKLLSKVLTPVAEFWLQEGADLVFAEEVQKEQGAEASLMQARSGLLLFSTQLSVKGICSSTINFYNPTCLYSPQCHLPAS